MTPAFQRIAIVNRGEAAMRLIHAVHEWNCETDECLRTIALYTSPDRDAIFVREADEAVDLGSPFFVDPRDGCRKSTYVDYSGLERALRAARAEAAWVGWGFVAEHPAFAELCDRLDVVFIGPDASVMRRLGDKITAKRLAEEAGVPVVPWSGGPLANFEEARAVALRLGYPLLVKATAGGGGRGIRRVSSEAELGLALDGAREEALKAFGDGTLFLESLLTGIRHTEVQIVGDRYGTVWALGVRDCTVQRHNQKVLEESPSPVLTPDEDRALRESAVRLGQLAGYSGAGTVEFLFDPAERSFAFMEVNVRLQVEHPVTEMTTGVDLVKLQLHVARGGRLEGDAPLPWGHAIEVRLNAEDPENDFAPAPGTIDLFRLPTGPGVRVDTGVREGQVVPPEFDSMIAKVIAHGRNREEALARLSRALADLAVVIRGGMTNRAFLLSLLGRRELRRSETDVGWLDRLAASGDHVPREHAEVALLQAAIGAYDAEHAVELARFLSSAARGRPQVRAEEGYSVELRYRGRAYKLSVQKTGPSTYRIQTPGPLIRAHVEQHSSHEFILRIDERVHRVVYAAHGPDVQVEVDTVSHRITRDEGGLVRAPAPAVVVALVARPGDAVVAGDRLVVLEAMKTEMAVVAPFPGRVRQVLVAAGVQVDAGAPLVLLAPEEERSSLPLTESLDFARAIGSELPPAGRRLAAVVADARHLLLGFDGNASDARRLAEEWAAAVREGGSDDQALSAACEEECLRIFADLEALFTRQPGRATPNAPDGRSAEGYLFSYLRSVETRGRALPARFMASLECLLRHYGVTSLEPSSGLEECLFRICRAHRRVTGHVPILLSILERRLGGSGPVAPQAADGLRELLDRFVTVTHRTEPALADLARELRHRSFDRPIFEQARHRVYASAEAQLDYLARCPSAPDRDERIRALVECPQPLVSLLAGRFQESSPSERALMLEVLLRRYYRLRNLCAVRQERLQDDVYVLAEYEYEGSRFHVVTVYAPYNDLRNAALRLLPLFAQLPADHPVVVDLFSWRVGSGATAEETQRELHALVNELPFPRPLYRVCFAVAGPGRGRGMSGMLHFTYRPLNGAYAEDAFLRGLHPMMAERLHLWRLANFETRRLSSAEDVYVVHAVARTNPRDERLFAVAEVRDLTPVRDTGGYIVRLPDLERMLLEALAGIRNYQSRLATRRRLHWNRVFLYVWPPLECGPQPLIDTVRRLSSEMEDLGLEKIVLAVTMQEATDGELHARRIELDDPASTFATVTFRPPATEPLEPLSDYTQKVVAMRQRGLVYPYELIRMLTPPREAAQGEFPPGEFIEYDLDKADQLLPVERPPGRNLANLVIGVMRNFTDRHPDGMARVLIASDPSRDMGALAEPECRRIVAALGLARDLQVPVDWFAVSSGARIAMDTGTETMDWTARVLRAVIEFTQAGGEVNVVVAGINVGAQSYWNAEATMLMHTRGVLVMTADASMVLTGKRALDYSGGVSAEDHLGIGGFDRIMGPNGEAQYRARDVAEASRILLRHHAFAYVSPGERFPRRAMTSDPYDRDVRSCPHGPPESGDFATVGEIFADESNPGRRKPFDIRHIMAAAVDRDHPPLERWSAMLGAETAVVWDARLGGHSVCLIGIESHPLPRLGFVPADGPDQWTAGTLFPLSSKKVVRAISGASGRRPVVVLANLSGFDGSPESLRELQLEYGAEIGRAVVNFYGPIVFCVVSRYHGGAYVVFSKALNQGIEVAAIEGARASVIGGAPAAAVVFTAEVDARTSADPRITATDQEITDAQEPDRNRLRRRRTELHRAIRAEKLAELADEFDHVHSIARALSVGSLDRILPGAQLRPYLIDAVERGIERQEAPA